MRSESAGGKTCPRLPKCFYGPWMIDFYGKMYQVLPSGLFGGFKWPFQGLSDVHLGDQKVTWKKLVGKWILWHAGHDMPAL